jgi:hypothetical protein
MNPSIQTLAESLGITEPKNGTWLQAIIDNDNNYTINGLNVDFTDALNFVTSGVFDEEVGPTPFVGDFMGFKGLTGGTTVHSGIFDGSIDEISSISHIRTVTSSDGSVSEVFGSAELLGKNSIFFYPDVDGEVVAFQEAVGYDSNGVVAYWNLIKLNDNFEQVSIGMSSNSTGISIDNDLSDNSATLFNIQDNTSASVFEVRNDGVFLPNIPTVDPVNAGQLWLDGTTLKVSAGV